VDGYAVFRLPIRRVRAGADYRVYVQDINDIHGNRISRTALVVGVPGLDRPDPAGVGRYDFSRRRVGEGR